MDNEVSITPLTPGHRSPDQIEQTAAVFFESGVRLRQFSPVRPTLNQTFRHANECAASQRLSPSGIDESTWITGQASSAQQFSLVSTFTALKSRKEFFHPSYLNPSIGR